MNIKRLVCVFCVIITVASVLAACSKASSEEKTTKFEVTEEGEFTTDPNQSTTDASDVVFYDRDGKSYSLLTEIPYYTQDGKVFYYAKSNGKSVFVDENGKEYDVNKCFIDPRGYFVYDTEGDITLDESSLMGTGKDGLTYFPAITIRWTEDNKMKLAFGFGKEIDMLDENLEIK